MSAPTTRRSRLTAAHGFSLAETAAMLTALSILTAVATPSVDGFVSRAKAIKASADVQTIAVALTRYAYDMGGMRHAVKKYALLAGEGAVPGLGPDGSTAWLAGEEGAGGSGASVGFLTDELVTNAARHDRKRGAFFAGWRGPYLQSGIGPDPWGHRYAVNISADQGADVFVLSAGADGLVETPFNASGVMPGGNDIVALVSTGSGS